MKIREHRGLLVNAMKTVKEVNSRSELINIIQESLSPYGVSVTSDDIKIKFYGGDDRIGWDTHIITIKGYGVWGFSDGDFKGGGKE